MITIELLEKADEPTARAMNVLLPAMTATAWPMTTERLARILAAPGWVYVARDREQVVGVAQCAIVHQLKDTKAWVEDVVVDPGYRGRGIARQLLEAIIAKALEAGIRSLNMTSRPERTAAHSLYTKLGFRQRDTSIYRLPLADDHM